VHSPLRHGTATLTLAAALHLICTPALIPANWRLQDP